MSNSSVWKRTADDPEEEGLYQVAFDVGGDAKVSVAKWYADRGWSRNVTERDSEVYWKPLADPPKRRSIRPGVSNS